MFLDVDQKDPGKIAAIDEGANEVTYGDMVRISQQVRDLLRPRELVFCLCRNQVGALAGYVALYENKDVSLLLGAKTDRALLDELLNLYRPSYLWLPEARACDFPFELVFCAYRYSLVKTGWEAPAMNDDLSFLLTTSGTTGSPKLVRHKYGNLEANARNVAKVFGWTDQERSICDLPMQYTMGLNVINSTLYAGGTVLLCESGLTDVGFWDFIKKQRGTNFTGVPYSYEVLDKLRFTRMRMPDLHTIAEGGGKLSDEMFMKLANYAKETGRRFFATFGTTETSARLAYLDPKIALDKCGSIGQAIPEGEMYLIDEEGSIVGRTEAEGELAYRGPNVTMGYAVTADDLKMGDVFRGEYHTGDIARRDEGGYYYIIGRKKRFLKLFGLRVSLDQMERMIGCAFGVACACVGDDKRMRVYFEGEADPEGILRFIGQRTGLLTSVFDVRQIDTLPRNDTGKIAYKALEGSVDGK